jgi:ammonium transporter Rh
MVTAIGLQWALFTESFFDQLYNNTQADHWHLVHINIYSLLNALYAISAVLISFGAVIGKISPYQLVVMAVIELGCHSFNYKILMSGVVNLVDLGGTYIDHMFGAYFGLSVAYMLGRPTKDPEMVIIR